MTEILLAPTILSPSNRAVIRELTNGMTADQLFFGNLRLRTITYKCYSKISINTYQRKNHDYCQILALSGGWKYRLWVSSGHLKWPQMPPSLTQQSRRGEFFQKYPEPSNICTLIPEECVVMGAANRQQGPGFIRRCKNCFTVVERDDLVIATVND